MMKIFSATFIHTTSIVAAVFTVSLILSKCTINALIEGENCSVLLTNENGQCIDLNHCEYAKNRLLHKQNPGTCGFKRNNPLVCCPIQQKLKARKPGTLSQEKCKGYFRLPLRRILVSVGEPALVREFPHMAAVGFGENKINVVWLCGGSLISHLFVLSAAHCAYSLDFGPPKWIRLGDLDLKITTEDASPTDIKINQTYVHPDYKPSSHYHDIALFKMERSTNFGKFIKPACLHVKKELPVDTLQVTGWGQVEFLGDTSSHLLKATLSVVDHGTCAERYANVSKTRKLSRGILDMYQICAGDAGGRDTCPGDSGGPLQYEQDLTEEIPSYFGSVRSMINSHFMIVGVTSFGQACAGNYSVGVYTRVLSYVGWIESIVWKEDD